MTRTTGRGVRVGLALTLPILVVNAALTWWSIHQIAEHGRQVSHTLEVQAAIAVSLAALEDAQSAHRNYVITGSPAFLGHYETATSALRADTDRLASLTTDNPSQQAHTAAARSHIDRRLAHLAESARLRQERGLEAASAFIRTGSGLREMDAARDVFAAMRGEEQELLRDRSTSARQAYVTAMTTTVIWAIASFALIALTYAIVGRTTASRARAEALQEADRRKDEFLATLAHELRNPLAAIRAALDSIRLGGETAPAIDRPIATIDHQAEHLSRLIEDLLDSSRIVQGKFRMRHETVDLKQAIDLAVETSRPMLDARGQNLAIDPPPAPLILDGDRDRLAQVFANLLTNAARYSGAGSRIWLTVGREARQAVVRVRDEGRGIAPEMIPRLFDLFAQEDRPGGDAQGGLGIGLSLVKRLVEMHGGAVEASSDGPGRGSEFLVRLPLSREVPTPVEGQARVEPRPEAASPPAGRPRRILLADDNVEFIELYAMMLGRHGHQIEVSHDGAAAIQTAIRLRPDVVLLDIGLPELDGFEVAKRLRDHPETNSALLIALSGSAHEEDRRHALSVGFDTYLSKPVRFAEVEELLTLRFGPQSS